MTGYPLQDEPAWTVGKDRLGSTLVKRGFAHMLKHGVVMDVTNVEQAQTAEEAGAVAVMVLDKLPYDVRKAGGIARTASVKVIEAIMDHVTIPVMAKCRIGHTAEAQVLEAVGVDMIDESEVLTPADEERHIWKWDFKTPFVAGARSLGEALRRIEEGASMIRTKGEPGTGNVAEAVKHFRVVKSELAQVRSLYLEGDTQELLKVARSMNVTLNTLVDAAKINRLPVVNFAAGGIATPADAAEMMLLGADGVFVGSGIFKSNDPLERARAIVHATTYFDNPEIVAEFQRGVDEQKSMEGLDQASMVFKMQERGT
ncbi:MAG: pyridoxal 5'-phosphate synthase lyase subunit PdxS [Thermoprotei archaeon]